MQTTLRVWDVLFYEGAKVLFHAALAVFKVLASLPSFWSAFWHNILLLLKLSLCALADERKRAAYDPPGRWCNQHYTDHLTPALWPWWITNGKPFPNPDKFRYLRFVIRNISQTILSRWRLRKSDQWLQTRYQSRGRSRNQQCWQNLTKDFEDSTLLKKVARAHNPNKLLGEDEPKQKCTKRVSNGYLFTPLDGFFLSLLIKVYK